MKTEALELGIGESKVSLGAHIAFWYRGLDERRETLKSYLSAGLKARQLCLAVLPEAGIDEFKASARGAMADGLADGSLRVFPAEEWYFKNKRFHPHRLIASYPDVIRQAEVDGYKSVRAAGEMPWRLLVHVSMPALFEYEERLNADFFECYPAIGLCLFDMERFGTEWTLGILRTHPMMVANNTAFQNPSYYQS